MRVGGLAAGRRSLGGLHLLAVVGLGLDLLVDGLLSDGLLIDGSLVEVDGFGVDMDVEEWVRSFNAWAAGFGRLDETVLEQSQAGGRQRPSIAPDER